MKRLFFFIIIAHWMHFVMCSDEISHSTQKTSVFITTHKALDKWWNEDTGIVSENFIKTAHQKQEARENIFHCDISACKRRDVRRMMTIIGIASIVSSVAIPSLAVPILSYGTLCTGALGFNLVAYKAPDSSLEDSKK